MMPCLDAGNGSVLVVLDEWMVALDRHWPNVNYTLEMSTSFRKRIHATHVEADEAHADSIGHILHLLHSTLGQ